MNQPRPAAQPHRKGGFEPQRPRPPATKGGFDPSRPKPPPRELPRAPEHDRRPMSLGQIFTAAVLVCFGIGLIGVFALGLPLDLIGGKVVVFLPLLGLVFLLRGRKRR
jgi:hypothetical protein